MTATSFASGDSADHQAPPDSFGTRLDSCRDRLRQLARVRMHPLLQQRLDLDDVIQDIHLAAWQRLKYWEAGVPVSFFVWLRSIAIQTIHNLHRFHFATEQRSLLHERPQLRQLAESSASQQLLGSITSPSQCAMRNESHTQLLETLDSLSDDDREMITLRIFEDLSNVEAAEVFGISEKAASIRYVRAIDRLRRKMEQRRTQQGRFDA